MAQGRPSVFAQRKYWVAFSGLVALAFWVVAIGVGARGWILTGGDSGIVAHVMTFGVDAAPWIISAAIMTMTTVMMGVGLAIVRRLAEGPATKPLLELEPKEPLEPLEPKEPVAPTAAPAASEAGDGPVVADAPQPSPGAEAPADDPAGDRSP